MKGFAWQGLDRFCDGTLVGEQSDTFSGTTGAFPSPFRVFGPYDQAGSAGDVVDISGTVKKKSTQVVNGLITVFFNNGFCSAPPLGLRSFTATKQWSRRLRRPNAQSSPPPIRTSASP